MIELSWCQLTAPRNLLQLSTTHMNLTAASTRLVVQVEENGDRELHFYLNSSVISSASVQCAVCANEHVVAVR